MNTSTKQIVLVCITFGTAISAYIFMASRTDPGLRMAALVSSSNLATALVAIASTMLTGKDLTKSDPADLPPGTLQTSTDTVQTPPITAPVTTPPKP